MTPKTEIEELKIKLSWLKYETEKQHSLLVMISQAIENSDVEDSDLKNAVTIAVDMNFALEKKIKEYSEGV